MQHGEITLDKPTSETSVQELTDLVVSEYRRAREEDRGERPPAQQDAPAQDDAQADGGAEPPSGESS